MKRTKFQLGQRVRIKNLPTPKDILCDTGEIIRVHFKFPRTPSMKQTLYLVQIDGRKGMFKHPILGNVYRLSCTEKNLEQIKADTRRSHAKKT